MFRFEKKKKVLGDVYKQNLLQYEFKIYIFNHEFS